MSNFLRNETSPYLLQHADNPVHWHPWGPEALARARAEDRPILLSIGYSACHWCHVMAHESFEDPATAAVMNDGFINIKVDREERPDLDQIYQAAHHLLTRRSGGWPLTVFLAPDQAPFFAGTYFPRESRWGMPGFVQVLERVLLAWRTRRHEIEEQNRLIVDALGRVDGGAALDAPGLPPADLIDRAVEALRSRFDPRHGGFGAAPKFPHPTDIELCLRRHARTGDREALHVALHTLRQMASGGIRDHLGGGFCRYSVDDRWEIPHFEKMLYDNALLLPLYAEAFTVSREPLFAEVAAGIATWLMREMQSPEGGYYSSLDADSEGEEGRYYVWQPDEVRSLLEPAAWTVTAARYGLDGPANFVDPHGAAQGGAWHLRLARPVEAAAAAAGVSPQQAEELLAAARTTLLAARERRVRPGRDEKILTGWNALAIAGMARAACVFDRADWAASARRAVDAVLGTMFAGDRLLATSRDGRAHLPAYLDDYAGLVAALLELMQWSFVPGDLATAIRLADALLERFEDRERGGFYFTAHDHEPLIQRGRPGHDAATPSGNALAARALATLGLVSGEARFDEAAARTLHAFGTSLVEQPAAFAGLLLALEALHAPPALVVLRGEPAALPGWRAHLAAACRPGLIAIATSAPAATLPAPLALPLPERGVLAYVCRGGTCAAPVDRLEALDALLPGAASA